MSGGWWQLRAHPLLLSLLVLASLMSVDWASGTQITGVYSGATLLASMLASVRHTAVVAVAATSGALVAGTWQGNVGTRDWAVRAALCALLSGACVLAAVSRTRREHRLTRLSAIAEAAQRAVLRTLPTAVGQAGIAGRYVSAYEDAAIGGDLYEVLDTEHGVRLVLGDVRGKGLEAVQLAASVLNAFRQAAPSSPSLRDLAVRLDRVVAAVSGDEDFVTAVLAELHDDGSFDVVNCGHHPPLLLDGVGSAATSALLDTGPPTLPLGMGDPPTIVRQSWTRGGRLLFYTDGLVEARGSKGTFFPLLQHAGVLRDPSLDSALDQLVDRLLAHTGSQLGDDMALLLAERR